MMENGSQSDRACGDPPIHWEQGTIARRLACAGIVDPKSGREYSESFLLGVGGGLGGGYMMFDSCGWKYLAIGFRKDCRKYLGEFSITACERLGISVETFQAGGRRAAAHRLEEAVAAGRPVWLHVSEAALAHRGLPAEWAKRFVYGLAVTGRDGEMWIIDDLAPQPLYVSLDELAAARATMPHSKNFMLVLGEKIARPDLAGAVRAGIADAVETQKNPSDRNLGLAAWQKWAEELESEKSPRGWTRLLAASSDLQSVLVTTYGHMLRDAGAGCLRGQYSCFLRNAALLLKRPELDAVADRYDALGGMWSEFFTSLLPGHIEVLRRQRELADERDALLRSQPPAARERLQQIRELQEELRAAQDPWSDAERTTFQRGWAERLRELHRMETTAVDHLAGAMA